MNPGRLNVPNSITILRILLLPLLVLLAWRRSPLFTVLLVAVLLMDILDGYLARRLHQQTRLGAQLDSWGDFLTVLVYPFAAIWLRPDATRQNAVYAEVAACAYLLPILIGFLKYRRLTSYHTRLMTGTAYVMGAAMVAFFSGGSVWPFRIGSVLLVAAQIEELAITIPDPPPHQHPPPPGGAGRPPPRRAPPARPPVRRPARARGQKSTAIDPKNASGSS